MMLCIGICRSSRRHIQVCGSNRNGAKNQQYGTFSMDAVVLMFGRRAVHDFILGNDEQEECKGQVCKPNLYFGCLLVYK